MEIDPATADFMSVMAPGHYYRHERVLAAPRPETFNTDDFFNHEPPSAMVSFIIGGVSDITLGLRLMGSLGFCMEMTTITHSSLPCIP